MMSGKLLPDTEAGLMFKLDQYLFRARKETGKYPDLIEVPSEPFVRFCPVPFDINFYGLTLKSYQKPAWFTIPKHIAVSVPWRKE